MTVAGAGLLNLGQGAGAADRAGASAKGRAAQPAAEGVPEGGFDRALAATATDRPAPSAPRTEGGAARADWTDGAGDMEAADAETSDTEASVATPVYAIPGASGETLAEARSTLGRGLADLAEAARAQIDRAVADGVPPKRAAAEAAQELAGDLAALLAQTDAATGGNARDVVAAAVAAAQAEGTAEGQGAEAAATGAEALLTLAASALQVAPPVGRSLDVPPPRGAAQTGQAARALDLAATALDRAAPRGAAPDAATPPAGDLRVVAPETPPEAPADLAAREAPARERGTEPRAGDPRSQPVFAASDDRRAAAAAPAPATATLGLRPVPGAEMPSAAGPSAAPEAGLPAEAARQSVFAADRAPAAAAAPAPRLAASVLAQMREARATADPTAGRTRIELSPRGLGALEVDLVTDPAGTTRIVIRAENPVVLDAMRGDRAALGDMLSDGGDRDGRFALDFEMFGDRDGGRGDADIDEAGGAGDAVAAADPAAAEAEPRTDISPKPGADPSAPLDILT